MAQRPISRRNFVVSSATAAFAAPFLRAADGLAQAKAPKRIIFFFVPVGTVYEFWKPLGGGSNYSFADNGILKPLDAHRRDLLVLDGIDLKIAYDDATCAHAAASALLTGNHHLPIGSSGLSACQTYTGGASIDQVIAKAIGQGTRFPSIELVASHIGRPPIGASSLINQTGSGGMLLPEPIPSKAFDRIFSDFVGDKAALAAQRARQKSALDLVQEDLKSLKAKLGKDSGDKLDDHADAFRDLERQLTPAPENPSCNAETLTVSGLPTGPSDVFHAKFRETVKAQIDIMVTAMACDLTRVATFNLWNTYVTHSWVGSKSEHHELSHRRGIEGANGDKERARRAYGADMRWVSTQFAYLLDQMKARGLMENTLIVWLSEMGDGDTHWLGNIPVVLAGDAGGFFRTGRYLKFGNQRAYENPANPYVFSGVNHNRLLMSICHAMGVNVSRVGDPAYCVGGALRELQA